MVQLCLVGRCWIVLFLTVIEGLLRTVDLTELENDNALLNTKESVLPHMASEDKVDDGDYDDHDDHETFKCKNLGVDALRRILGLRPKYAAGQMMKKVKAHTLANAIGAEYESLLSFLKPDILDDEMRLCQDLGKNALKQILLSRSNSDGHTGNKQIRKKWNKNKTGHKNQKGNTKSGKPKKPPKKSQKPKRNKKPKKPKKPKITKKRKSKKRTHILANSINAEYAVNIHSETGTRYVKKYETPLPKHMKKFMKEVPLQEIEEKIRTAKDKYDTIRIFLKDKDVSDEAITEMLRSKPRQQTRDRGKIRVKKEKENPEAHNLANAFDAENAGSTDDSGDKDTFLKDLAEAERHFQEQMSDPLSQCRTPQPKAIYMKQPMKPDSILPACTIVFRCRNNSGCCTRGQECAPTKRTEVQRAFMAVEHDENGKTKKNIVTKTFTNHMECNCRDLQLLADCTLKCPSMFQMRRRGTDCVCDCFSKADNATECKRIKNGRKALSDEDLACVTDGRCSQPTCSVGQFDVSQGKCPKKTKNV